jgi:peptide deformylase
MTILPILIAPHPVLKKKAVSVDKITDKHKTLMDDMLDTMYEAPGIGLAAPQVGVSERIIVLDISRDNDAPAPLRMVNPVVTWSSDKNIESEEGCLSFPDQYANVKRPDMIKVTYMDETGTQQEIEADGLLATCLQHEIDHLDGVNFVDYLSALKRGIIMRKLKKNKR